ncbi:polysaccharide pyruvyl transferase family protein [Kiritimatiellaeota bacterium B1221]|nr:polysaccharide pyruvyl transferase family protein [Kiritimatiellaeota bacterium B1221]
MTPTHPNILLRTGWATQNVGDVAHTPGTLCTLYSRFPDAEITVWANHLNEEIRTMLWKRFPRVKIISGNIYDKEKPCPPEIDAAFEAADLFIFNSGMAMNFGLFNFDWNGPVYNLMPLMRCIEQGIPFGIYGQSFDRFAHPSVSLFKPILDQAAFIFTRETHSEKYLRELGFDAEVIEFGPDGAFGIDTRADEKAEAWLSGHGLEAGEFLIMNIRTNTPVSPDSDSPLNPSRPTPQQQQENEKWLQACATVITRWVRVTGRKVLIAPEAFKEIEAAMTLLHPRLPEDVASRVVIRDSWWNADEALSTFTRARVAFGVEPHTLIMALTGCVPIVHARPLRHGRKGWMFEDLGLGGWLFDIDATSTETLSNTVLEIDGNYTRACHQAQRAYERVQTCQARTLDVIAKTLETD